MIQYLIFSTGRSAGKHPAGALIVIAAVIAFLLGWLDPEDYPAECDTSHLDHAAYVAEHPDACP